jgi:hypothetical protein
MKTKLLPVIIFITLISIPLSIKAQDARLIAKNTFPSVVMLEMRDSNRGMAKIRGKIPTFV